ncbi:hypothetical protein CDD83_9735 [Cordyceps sp. RAO-2017]|nr:hypothetical protein CDD83_9735 [Cordyceps sp. RAO-2017]
MPADGGDDGTDWPALVDAVRRFVLDTVEARTGERGLRDGLVAESVDTPPSWRAKFNLDRGAILGLSHGLSNVLAFRPRTRHPRYRGLYFVGSSTHPGAGVPVCLAGGKIVSEQILADWDRAGRRWTTARGLCWVAALALALPLFVWLFSRLSPGSL